MAGSGGALGELWEAQGQLWEALGELWEGLYIQKLPINRTSGRYVIRRIVIDGLHLTYCITADALY